MSLRAQLRNAYARTAHRPTGLRRRRRCRYEGYLAGARRGKVPAVPEQVQVRNILRARQRIVAQRVETHQMCACGTRAGYAVFFDDVNVGLACAEWPCQRALAANEDARRE